MTKPRKSKPKLKTKSLLSHISRRDWRMVNEAGFLSDAEKARILGVRDVLDRLGREEKEST